MLLQLPRELAQAAAVILRIRRLCPRHSWWHLNPPELVEVVFSSYMVNELVHEWYELVHEWYEFRPNKLNHGRTMINQFVQVTSIHILI